MEQTFKCENCPMRAKYDKNQESFGGRFWRWHINFCPGWKAYFKAQTPEKKDEIRKKYNFNKYQGR